MLHIDDLGQTKFTELIKKEHLKYITNHKIF